MKKTICVVLLIFLAIIVVIYMNYNQEVRNKNTIKKMNAEYELYNREQVLGTDVTTVINKAIDNNELYGIPKDENGFYILDDEFGIKIYIHMIIDDTTYSMESIIKSGLANFTSYFGEVNFKCTNVKYHEATGRISEMTFVATEY